MFSHWFDANLCTILFEAGSKCRIRKTIGAVVQMGAMRVSTAIVAYMGTAPVFQFSTHVSHGIALAAEDGLVRNCTLAVEFRIRARDDPARSWRRPEPVAVTSLARVRRSHAEQAGEHERWRLAAAHRAFAAQHKRWLQRMKQLSTVLSRQCAADAARR